MPKQAQTRTAILDSAQALAQHRGFHGFSYRDIAADIGIRAPSIHHHFPQKEDLGASLMDRYREVFAERLADKLSGVPTGADRLDVYVTEYGRTWNEDGRLCLCAMFSAEIDGLPPIVADATRRFQTENVALLTDIIAGGREDGTLRAANTDEATALMILAALEGGMLAARAGSSPNIFDTVTDALIKALKVTV